MKLSFRPERLSGWLALRQRGSEIDAAHIERRAGRLRVSLCETWRLPGGDVQPALTRLRNDKGLRRYRCTTLLAADEYQINTLDAPSVPAEELKAAARWRVKDLIDYPLETAAVGILDIPVDGTARQHSLYAVTARNEVIARYVQRYQQAGIGLEAIDIPELAQRNVAALFEEPERGLALLSFEEGGGLLTVTFRGELYLTRRIEIPLARLLAAEGAARMQLHERVTLEVQRSLDHVDRQFSFITLSRFLLAPLPQETGLADYLAANISLRLDHANIAEVLDCGGIPELSDPARQGFCLQMLGAALRDEGLPA